MYTPATQEMEIRLKKFLAETESALNIKRITQIIDVPKWFEKYKPVCRSFSEGTLIFEALDQLGESSTLYHVSLSQSDGEIAVMRCECQVTFEDVPLSQLIEYRFPEDPSGEWRVAAVTEEALIQLRKSMFASWEEQIKRPSCEAAFRRLLQAGPINKVFDKHMFPTPAELKGKYQVINETNGKIIDLPHPVESLRVFDASADSYREIDPILDGAPRSETSSQEYFEKLKTQLREDFGSDYIAALQDGKSCSS